MKKRVILILCVLAVLLTAVICLPFARKIDTSLPRNTGSMIRHTLWSTRS